MKIISRFGRSASLLAVVLMVLQPSLALGQQPAAQALASAKLKAEPMRTFDVALDADRGLRGQVVDVQGLPVANLPVTMSNAAGQWQAVTDAEGNYRVPDLRGGAYLVRVGDQLKQMRAWSPGTAPPAANRGLMMVHGNQLIRGQAFCGSPVGCGTGVGGGGIKDVLSHPLVIGGIIAAAIAIPVAIHNSDDDPAPAS